MIYDRSTANTYEHLTWMLNEFFSEFETSISDGTWGSIEVAMIKELSTFRQLAGFLEARTPPMQEKQALSSFLSRFEEVDDHVSNALRFKAFW